MRFLRPIIERPDLRLTDWITAAMWDRNIDRTVWRSPTAHFSRSAQWISGIGTTQSATARRFIHLCIVENGCGSLSIVRLGFDIIRGNVRLFDHRHGPLADPKTPQACLVSLFASSTFSFGYSREALVGSIQERPSARHERLFNGGHPATP